MKISDMFNDLLRDETRVYRPYFIALDGSFPQTEEVYFKLTLTQIFLKYSREYFTTRYPVVHAIAKFNGYSNVIETSRVIVPFAPGQVDVKHTERNITLNQRILEPVLYRGGDLELLIGLYAAPSNDWAQQFIDLAKGISQIALIGPMSTAVTIAERLSRSIENLLGSKQLELKLGINTILRQGQWLQSGYLAIIAAPVDKVNSALLRVENDTLYGGAKPYTEHDFMLIHLEVVDTRDDWQQLGLSDLWKQLIEGAMKFEDKTDIAKLYIQFSGAVMGTSDLSWTDRKAICKLAQRRILEIRELRDTDFLDKSRSGNTTEGNEAEIQAIMQALPPLELDDVKDESNLINIDELTRIDWL